MGKRFPQGGFEPPQAYPEGRETTIYFYINYNIPFKAVFVNIFQCLPVFFRICSLN